jgi:hypothetical protein
VLLFSRRTLRRDRGERVGVFGGHSRGGTKAARAIVVPSCGCVFLGAQRAQCPKGIPLPHGDGGNVTENRKKYSETPNGRRRPVRTEQRPTKTTTVVGAPHFTAQSIGHNSQRARDGEFHIEWPSNLSDRRNEITKKANKQLQTLLPPPPPPPPPTAS